MAVINSYSTTWREALFWCASVAMVATAATLRGEPLQVGIQPQFTGLSYVGAAYGVWTNYQSWLEWKLDVLVEQGLFLSNKRVEQKEIYMYTHCDMNHISL